MSLKNRRNRNQQAGVIVADNPTSIVSEEFRSIRTNIQFSMVDKKIQTLLVTSSTAESGKTTVAVNLAAAFAAEDARVLVVETDMRKPRIHKIFKSEKSQGIANLITNRDLLLEDVVQQSPVKNLSFLTCGPIPPNPSELLNSNRMTELIEEMKQQYDLVVFDSPPVLAVTDAQILSSKVDGTLFVIPEGEVKKEEVHDAAERLKKVNANVLGTIMNKVELDAEAYYYYESD